jgi:hypothetical protein
MFELDTKCVQFLSENDADLCAPQTCKLMVSYDTPFSDYPKLQCGWLYIHLHPYYMFIIPVLPGPFPMIKDKTSMIHLGYLLKSH